MSVLLLRRLADTAARDSFHRLLEHHAATGEWSHQLAAEYHVAEELLTLAEERIRDLSADAFDPGYGESFDPLPNIPLAEVAS